MNILKLFKRKEKIQHLFRIERSEQKLKEGWKFIKITGRVNDLVLMEKEK